MSESYSRLYHRFRREFPDIYADDHALAGWVRLLLVADASWPMRPPLPRSARASVVRCLESAGLLILDGDAYTVRGLDAERTRRRDAGRKGAAQRWQSDGNAVANANEMPRRDEYETSIDEQESPPPPAQRGRRKDRTNPRAVGTSPRLNGKDPRANGKAPRQEREAQKRAAMPQSVNDILRRAAAEGRG